MSIGALTKLVKIVHNLLNLSSPTGATEVGFHYPAVYREGSVGQAMVAATKRTGVDPRWFGADPTGVVDSSDILQSILDMDVNICLSKPTDIYLVKKNLWIGSQVIYGEGTLHGIVDTTFVPDPLGGFHAADALILNKGIGTKYPAQNPSPEIYCKIKFERYGADPVGTPLPDYPCRFYGTVNAVWAPRLAESFGREGCVNINGCDLYGFNKNFSYGGQNYVYAAIAMVGAGGHWIRDTSLAGRGREAASTGRVLPGSHFYTNTRDEPLAIFVTPAGGYIDGVFASGFSYHGRGNGLTVLDLSMTGDRIRNVCIEDFRGKVDTLRGGQRALGTTSCAATFRRGDVTVLGYENLGGALYAGFRAGDTSPLGELPICEDVKVRFSTAPVDAVPVYGFTGNADLRGQCETIGDLTTITAGIYLNTLGRVTDGIYRGVLSARAVRYVSGGKFYGSVRNVSEFDADLYWDPTVNLVAIQNLPVDGTYTNEKFARITPRVYQLADAPALSSVVESNRGAVGQHVEYFLDRTGFVSPGADLVTPVSIRNTGILKDGTFLGRREGVVSNPTNNKATSFPALDVDGFADIPHGLGSTPVRFDAKAVPAVDSAALSYAIEVVNVNGTNIRIRAYNKLTNAGYGSTSPRVTWWASTV